MKKLLLHLLLVPFELIRSVAIGIAFRKISGNSRIYIFDFDNTLAGTAKLIAKKESYKYDVQELELYSSMQKYLKKRKERGHHCLVLSARPRSDRTLLKKKLMQVNIDIPVEVVSMHWYKAICLTIAYSFKKSHVTLIDDMMRGEETGNPSKLYFPQYIVPRCVRLVTHETVLRIR
jgi:hypothetical protein